MKIIKHRIKIRTKTKNKIKNKNEHLTIISNLPYNLWKKAQK